MMPCIGCGLPFAAPTKRAMGTIALSSLESAPTLHFGLDSWRD
jgi:hypothetical protein